jgi:hypothetical protein
MASTLTLQRVLAADTAGAQVHKAHEVANYVLAGQAGGPGGLLMGPSLLWLLVAVRDPETCVARLCAFLKQAMRVSESFSIPT